MSSSPLRTGRLIVISAPSGTGKTTIVRRLLAQNPAWVHSVSHTTRPGKRPNEVEGIDYCFISSMEFQKRKEALEYAEWAEVHGNFYGTPKKPLEETIQKGRDILLDIDVQGGMALKEKYPENTVTIFLLPPSETELENRLLKRGTDSPEARAHRLENAKKELAMKDRYDHQVVNDDLETACESIVKILSTSVHPTRRATRK